MSEGHGTFFIVLKHNIWTALLTTVASVGGETDLSGTSSSQSLPV